MNTVYNVSYKDRIKKQEIQEKVLADFTKETFVRFKITEDY
jgi:hypothetical protein